MCLSAEPKGGVSKGGRIIEAEAPSVVPGRSVGAADVVRALHVSDVQKNNASPWIDEVVVDANRKIFGAWLVADSLVSGEGHSAGGDLAGKRRIRLTNVPSIVRPTSSGSGITRMRGSWRRSAGVSARPEVQPILGGRHELSMRSLILVVQAEQAGLRVVTRTGESRMIDSHAGVEQEARRCSAPGRQPDDRDSPNDASLTRPPTHAHRRVRYGSGLQPGEVTGPPRRRPRVRSGHSRPSPRYESVNVPQ